MTARRIALIVAVVAVLIAAGWYWAQGGSRLVTTTVSRVHGERVELRTADRWQAWQFHGLQMPGYARLVRTADGARLGDSATFDLDGAGEVFWIGTGDVQVGSTARYDRHAGRWRISPGG